MAIGRPLNLTANVASKNISVLSTAGQTSFTVAGGYRINEIAVYRNGTRLADGRDFTATDGSIVTLVSAATLGDVIEYQIFDSFNIADAVGTSGDSTINGNLTATSFIGDVTGNASGTAGGLTGSPDITINNLVGVAATFSGVVTYEDVTNIDSVGIVTARGGFEIGASGVGGTITAAGAATFKGYTTVGPYASATAGAQGVQLRDNGELLLNKNSGDAITIYNNSATKTCTVGADGDINIAASDGTSKVAILNSGAATFAGKITTTNTVKCRDVNSDYGGIYFSSGTLLPTQADGNFATTGLSFGTSSNKFNHLYLTGDVTAGAATFAGDVDVDGHTELDDVNVSGAITATTFTGNLTGNASGSSGSCTGNAATATLATNASGLTGTPDIAVTNVTSGIVTATSFSGDGSGLAGVGAWNLVATVTASNVDTADLTNVITNAYKQYVLVATEVWNNNISPPYTSEYRVRFMNGTTQNSSSKYYYSINMVYEGNGPSRLTSSNQSQILLGGSTYTGNANPHFTMNFNMWIMGGGRSSYNHTVYWTGGGNPNNNYWNNFNGVGGISLDSDYTVNGIRIDSIGGNMYGTFKLYGLS